MSETGSSVPRRQLGRILRQAREKAGLGLEPAARDLEISRARMYRIEAGQVPVRIVDAAAMCELYGVPHDLREVLISLARESKSKGWWHAYDDVVPAWFELYVGLEAAACRLRHYATGLVPGLLQVPHYAAAVVRTRADATEESVIQAVALRRDRQRLLGRRRPAAPTLEVILDEAVLNRAIPDHEGMVVQLRALAEANARPGIELRVLPSSAWPHRASIAASFVILDFPAVRPAEPTTVYSENLTGALYLDKPGEVATYDAAWQSLQTLALSPQDSTGLLKQMLKESSYAT